MRTKALTIILLGIVNDWHSAKLVEIMLVEAALEISLSLVPFASVTFTKIDYIESKAPLKRIRIFKLKTKKLLFTANC